MVCLSLRLPVCLFICSNIWKKRNPAGWQDFKGNSFLKAIDIGYNNFSTDTIDHSESVATVLP